MKRMGFIVLTGAVVGLALLVAPVNSQPKGAGDEMPIGRFACIRVEAAEENQISAWLLDTTSGQVYWARTDSRPAGVVWTLRIKTVGQQ